MAEDKNTFLDILGRVGEGAVDGIAQKSPVLGGMLQAGFQTQGWQDKQAAREDRQRAREIQELQKQKLIYDANQREKEAPVVDQELELRRLNAQMGIKQFPQREATQSAQYDAAQAQAQYAAAKADSDHHALGMQKVGDQLRREMQANGSLDGLTPGEQDALLSSPQARNLIELKYYTQEIMNMAGGDRTSFGRLERLFRNNGLSLVDGPDGVKYVSSNNLGWIIPANKDGLDEITQLLSSQAAAEISARQTHAKANSEGNPQQQVISEAVGEMSQLTNGSYIDAEKKIYDNFTRMPEQQQQIAVLDQTLQNLRKNVPGAMEGAKKALQTINTISTLGIKVVGADQEGATLETCKFWDVNAKREIPFSEVEERVHALNVWPKVLQDGIEHARWILANQDGTLRRMMLANDVGLGGGGAGAPGAKGGAKTPGAGMGEEQSDAARDAENDSKRAQAVIKQYGLGNTVEQLWRSRPEGSKTITSRDYVILNLGYAMQTAEDAYAQTGNWDDAEKAARKHLIQAGFEERNIPELFGTRSREQKLAKLDKQKRELIERNQGRRKNDPRYQRRISSDPGPYQASPPPLGDVDINAQQDYVEKATLPSHLPSTQDVDSNEFDKVAAEYARIWRELEEMKHPPRKAETEKHRQEFHRIMRGGKR